MMQGGRITTAGLILSDKVQQKACTMRGRINIAGLILLTKCNTDARADMHNFISLTVKDELQKNTEDLILWAPVSPSELSITLCITHYITVAGLPWKGKKKWKTSS